MCVYVCYIVCVCAYVCVCVCACTRVAEWLERLLSGYESTIADLCRR